MLEKGTLVSVRLVNYGWEAEAHVIAMGPEGVLLHWTEVYAQSYPSKTTPPRRGLTVFYPWHKIDSMEIVHTPTQKTVIEEKNDA